MQNKSHRSLWGTEGRQESPIVIILSTRALNGDRPEEWASFEVDGAELRLHVITRSSMEAPTLEWVQIVGANPERSWSRFLAMTRPSTAAVKSCERLRSAKLYDDKSPLPSPRLPSRSCSAEPFSSRCLGPERVQGKSCHGRNFFVFSCSRLRAWALFVAVAIQAGIGEWINLVGNSADRKSVV